MDKTWLRILAVTSISSFSVSQRRRLLWDQVFPYVNTFIQSHDFPMCTKLFSTFINKDGPKRPPHQFFLKYFPSTRTPLKTYILTGPQTMKSRHTIRLKILRGFSEREERVPYMKEILKERNSHPS